MQQQYAWRLGDRFKKNLDAQVIGEHIEDLYQKYGEHLTKEEILSAARATQSPLHKVFTWNENDAAEKQRNREAVALMNNLVLRRRDKPTKTRAFVFVHHPEHKRKVYVTMQSAMRNPEMKRELVEKALKQLDGWIARFGTARELRRVHKSVEVLQRRIEAEYLSVLTDAS